MNKPHLKYSGSLWYCSDKYDIAVAQTPKDAWALLYWKSKTFSYEIERTKQRFVYLVKEVFRLIKGNY